MKTSFVPGVQPRSCAAVVSGSWHPTMHIQGKRSDTTVHAGRQLLVMTGPILPSNQHIYWALVRQAMRRLFKTQHPWGYVIWGCFASLHRETEANPSRVRVIAAGRNSANLPREDDSAFRHLLPSAYYCVLLRTYSSTRGCRQANAGPTILVPAPSIPLPHEHFEKSFGCAPHAGVLKTLSPLAKKTRPAPRRLNMDSF